MVKSSECNECELIRKCINLTKKLLYNFALLYLVASSFVGTICVLSGAVLYDSTSLIHPMVPIVSIGIVGGIMLVLAYFES